MESVLESVQLGTLRWVAFVLKMETTELLLLVVQSIIMIVRIVLLVEFYQVLQKANLCYAVRYVINIILYDIYLCYIYYPYYPTSIYSHLSSLNGLLEENKILG